MLTIDSVQAAHPDWFKQPDPNAYKLPDFKEVAPLDIHNFQQQAQELVPDNPYYDKLGKYIEDLRATSGPRQFSPGERLIQFSMGMKGPGDLGGGFGEQYKATEAETAATRDRAYKNFELLNGLAQARDRQQQARLAVAQGLMSTEQQRQIHNQEEQSKHDIYKLSFAQRLDDIAREFPGKSLETITKIGQAQAELDKQNYPEGMRLIYEITGGDRAAAFGLLMKLNASKSQNPMANVAMSKLELERDKEERIEHQAYMTGMQHYYENRRAEWTKKSIAAQNTGQDPGPEPKIEDAAAEYYKLAPPSRDFFARYGSVPEGTGQPLNIHKISGTR